MQNQIKIPTQINQQLTIHMNLPQNVQNMNQITLLYYIYTNKLEIRSQNSNNKGYFPQSIQ